jgi:hypothetical protein
VYGRDPSPARARTAARPGCWRVLPLADAVRIAENEFGPLLASD